MRTIVVDFGGTHWRAAVAEDGQLVSSIHRGNVTARGEEADAAASWRGILTAISAYVASVEGDVPPDAPLVVSVPGPVSSSGAMLDAPTFAGDDHAVPDLRAALGMMTGRTAVLLNDMSAAAWRFARQLPAERFLVVTISSGIGSKIVDRARPHAVLDDVPYAGEIGHLTVDTSPDAARCDCGGRGHLGAIASGRGVIRMAQRRAAEDPWRFLESLCVTRFGASLHELSNEEHLVPALLEGDGWATEVLEECVRPLAQVILTTVVAMGLEKVVVTGGFAQALGEVYVATLRQHLEELADYTVLGGLADDLLIVPGADDEVCLLGAAEFARLRLATPGAV